MKSSLLLNQGAITLLAQLLVPMFAEALIAVITSVGSLLLIATTLNRLGITKDEPYAWHIDYGGGGACNVGSQFSIRK